MRWSVPGLNTRETALLVWVGGVLVYQLANNRDLRRSVLGLLKMMLLGRWIAGVVYTAAVYTAATILLLLHARFWAPGMVKPAVLWFVGFTFVAMFNTKNTDAGYYRRLALHNLGLFAIVEFVTNVHTFPLPVELLLVPATLLLVLMKIVAASNPETAVVSKLARWCLTAIGLTVLALSLTYVIGNFHDVATAEKVKEFLLPLVLTVCFIPFLVALRYLTVWETILSMIRSGLRGNASLYRFTRWEIIKACGVSLGKAQLFESQFRGRLFGAQTQEDVTEVVDAFRDSWERGRRVRVEHEEQPGF